MTELKYRYTNHTLYTIFYYIFAALFLMLCVGIISLVIRNAPRSGAVTVFMLLAMLLGVLGAGFIGHFVSRKVCDRRGTMQFFTDHVELWQGGKQYSLCYKGMEIREIKLASLRQAVSGVKITGPHYVHYTIANGGDKVKISSSVKEGWELVGGFRGMLSREASKPEYSIDHAVTELRKHLSQEATFRSI